MVWTIEFDKKAKKEFVKLDKSSQKKIDKFILKLIKSKNPRLLGQSLKGTLQSFWKYRIGDFRLICNIEDEVLIIIVLRVAHRKEIYKKSV